MKEPKYIKIFNDYADEFGMITNEQTGRLINGLLYYVNHGEKPDFSDDTTLMVLFSILRKQIDREYEKYDELCQARSAAGHKGGAPKGNTNARKTSKTTKTTQDNDKDNDNDNDDDKDKDKETEGAQAPYRASPALYLPEVDEVVEYLNQKAGTHYRPTAAGTRRLIAALLNEGYDTRDMKRVIDSKCAEWLNSEFSRYLRPDVLFGKKFEGYLNAPAQSKRLPENKLHPWQNATQDSFLKAIEQYKPLYD